MQCAPTNFLSSLAYYEPFPTIFLAPLPIALRPLPTALNGQTIAAPTFLPASLILLSSACAALAVKLQMAIIRPTAKLFFMGYSLTVPARMERDLPRCPL